MKKSLIKGVWRCYSRSNAFSVVTGVMTLRSVNCVLFDAEDGEFCSLCLDGRGLWLALSTPKGEGEIRHAVDVFIHN